MWSGYNSFKPSDFNKQIHSYLTLTHSCLLLTNTNYHSRRKCTSFVQLYINLHIAPSESCNKSPTQLLYIKSLDLYAKFNMPPSKSSSKAASRKQPQPVPQSKLKTKQKIQVQSSINQSFKAPEQEIPYPHLPVILLEFDNDAHQRQALARIAAFYEHKTYKGSFIELGDERCKELGVGYEGFNCPVTAIENWVRTLACSVRDGNWSKAEVMTKQEKEQRKKERESSHKRKGFGGWRDMCNEGEAWLLETLKMKGWVNIDAVFRPANQPTREASSFTAHVTINKPRNVKPKSTGTSDGYLVSYLTTSLLTEIHELQHALYHFCPALQEYTTSLFNSNEILDKKQRERIRWELERRGYVEKVWMDEFQAYAVGMYHGDPDGFGNEILDRVCRRVGALIGKFCGEQIWDG